MSSGPQPLEAVYRSSWLALTRLAYLLVGDRTEAEDIVQTVFTRAANYVLGVVVLFAVALFFGGMVTKLRGEGTRRVLLVVGCLVFVGTAVWIATLPVSVSV